MNVGSGPGAVAGQDGSKILNGECKFSHCPVEQAALAQDVRIARIEAERGGQVGAGAEIVAFAAIGFTAMGEGRRAGTAGFVRGVVAQDAGELGDGAFVLPVPQVGESAPQQVVVGIHRRIPCAAVHQDGVGRIGGQSGMDSSITLPFSRELLRA